MPGVIGRVGTVIGRYDINIAGMEVGRHHRGGEAIMVVNVDNEIPDGALEEIRVIPGMVGAFKISLPADLNRPRPSVPVAAVPDTL